MPQIGVGDGEEVRVPTTRRKGVGGEGERGAVVERKGGGGGIDESGEGRRVIREWVPELIT